MTGYARSFWIGATRRASAWNQPLFHLDIQVIDGIWHSHWEIFRQPETWALRMKYVHRLWYVFTVGPSLLYMVGYLLSVEATVSSVAENHNLVPKYAFGGKMMEQVYIPAHWVDKQIRVKYWHGDGPSTHHVHQ
jgi:hypothetical protein